MGGSVEIDTCRIPVGDQWVHFSAYTPAITQDTEYCRSIPDLGWTNLVFDYENKILRKMTVEFEITKEPEGGRVYYKEPKPHKTGTVNAVVDFNSFGAGDYLIHVTLVNEGKKIDAHLPLSVGSGGFFNAYLLTGLVAISELVAVYFFIPAFPDKFSRLNERIKRTA